MPLISKGAGRLWIALAVVVFLLALNAVSTIFGWSPFASIVNDHIEERSRAADVRSKEQRDQARLAEQPRSEPKVLQGKQKSPVKPSVATTTAVTDNVAKKPEPPVVLKSPVAPNRPVAPQVPSHPVAPAPPVYIMYYPDGSVRYVTQPVYPAPLYPAPAR